MRAGRGRRVSRASDEALFGALEAVRARCDVAARREADPVHFVHRYESLEDREIVGVIASALAFGNVKALCAKIEDALGRLGPAPARVADDPEAVFTRLSGWRHRVYKDRDLARLLIGARRVQRAYGSLGAALVAKWKNAGELREALGLWVEEVRREGGFSEVLDGEEGRGAAHILPDPRRGSAVKRLLLLLRWMARPADGVDLGLWPIPTSRLVVPVDTHIHKLAQNLGLTQRKSADFRAAEEITAALARLDPEDPVKYDFSLCHLGMLQGCPSRRDEARCEGCGVKPVCRHWQGRGAGQRASASSRT